MGVHGLSLGDGHHGDEGVQGDVDGHGEVHEGEGLQGGGIWEVHGGLGSDVHGFVF